MTIKKNAARTLGSRQFANEKTLANNFEYEFVALYITPHHYTAQKIMNNTKQCDVTMTRKACYNVACQFNQQIEQEMPALFQHRHHSATRVRITETAKSTAANYAGWHVGAYPRHDVRHASARNIQRPIDVSDGKPTLHPDGIGASGIRAVQTSQGRSTGTWHPSGRTSLAREDRRIQGNMAA